MFSFIRNYPTIVQSNCTILLHILINTLLFFISFGHVACGILVSSPGIEPAPPALEGKVSTAGPPGKSQTKNTYLISIYFKVSWSPFKYQSYLGMHLNTQIIRYFSHKAQFNSTDLGLRSIQCNVHRQLLFLGNLSKRSAFH